MTAADAAIRQNYFTMDRRFSYHGTISATATWVEPTIGFVVGLASWFGQFTEPVSRPNLLTWRLACQSS